MISRNVKSTLAVFAGATMLAGASAQAGYVCQDNKAGEKTDVSGSLVLQSNGSYVIEQPDGGYLIQVVGFSEGEKVDSYLYINEATRIKMQRCSKPAALSFQVKCKAKGEPEVTTLVC